MPNIRSAKKRVRVIKKKTLRNKMIKSNLKTVIKAAINSIEQKAENAEKNFKYAVEKLDKAVLKGVIHKNKAANKKSSLQKMLNKANS